VASTKQLVERFYREVWNQADENVARLILDPEFRFRASLEHVPTDWNQLDASKNSSR
jgi:hypothetical protein